MTTTWILAANSCEAHLYSTNRAKLMNGDGELTLIEDFSHPEGRLKASELVEGRAGKYHQPRCGYGSFVESPDPTKVELEHFARALATKIREGSFAHSFDDLIVIAAPGFHGILNKSIEHIAIKQTVSLNIEKDYTDVRPRELAKLILEHL